MLTFIYLCCLIFGLQGVVSSLYFQPPKLKIVRASNSRCSHNVWLIQELFQKEKKKNAKPWRGFLGSFFKTLCLTLMRSAKSTLSQERDRDWVNKVNLEGAGKWACWECPYRHGNTDSGSTPQCAIIWWIKWLWAVLHFSHICIFIVYTSFSENWHNSKN